MQVLTATSRTIPSRSKRFHAKECAVQSLMKKKWRKRFFCLFIIQEEQKVLFLGNIAP
jgi:hypothetical protein